MMTKPTVAVIGLGKLGIPLVAVLADSGFAVIGVDVREDVVGAINRCESPIYEPGVQELLRNENISATTNIYSAASMADIIIVVVPTPGDSDGWLSSGVVEDVCHDLAEVIRDTSVYHLVVIASTVMPQTMDERILPLLESKSGKKVGADFGLCYSPLFIALGTVIRDVRHPSFVLIGKADIQSGAILEGFYRCLYDDSVPIVSMNFINAEIAKLALNCYLMSRITYANTIAQICEKIPGADANVITQAIGLDGRIGPSLMKGGVAAGGPCLPRDLSAVCALSRQLRLSNEFLDVLSETNLEMTARLLDIVDEYAVVGGVVGILGLAYKPNTDVIDESPGILLAEMLSEMSTQIVYAYDPAALKNARSALYEYNGILLRDSIEQVVDAADIVLIMTAWDVFKGIEHLFFDCVVVDCWRILDKSKLRPSVEYIALGVGECCQ